MLAEDLTTALQSATEGQPFTPDPSRAWARASLLRRRRRMAASGALLGATGLLAGGLVMLPMHVPQPTAFGAGAGPGEGATPGSLAFSVDQNHDPRNDAPCVLDIVLAGPATPERIVIPCGPFGFGDQLGAPMSRQDYVTMHGQRLLVTSGTAPKGTTEVTATDQRGTPLTATLHTAAFTDQVVFAMQSSGSGVKHLRYRLADGRYSEENDVSTPSR